MSYWWLNSNYSAHMQSTVERKRERSLLTINKWLRVGVWTSKIKNNSAQCRVLQERGQHNIDVIVIVHVITSCFVLALVFAFSSGCTCMLFPSRSSSTRDVDKKRAMACALQWQQFLRRSTVTLHWASKPFKTTSSCPGHSAGRRKRQVRLCRQGTNTNS